MAVPCSLSLVMLRTSWTPRLVVVNKQQATTAISRHCFFNLSYLCHFMKVSMLLPCTYPT